MADRIFATIPTRRGEELRIEAAGAEGLLPAGASDEWPPLEPEGQQDRARGRRHPAGCRHRCAERIPLSGSAGGRFAGDITTPVLGIDRTLEVKHRAAGLGVAIKRDSLPALTPAERAKALPTEQARHATSRPRRDERHAAP